MLLDDSSSSSSSELSVSIIGSCSTNLAFPAAVVVFAAAFFFKLILVSKPFTGGLLMIPSAKNYKSLIADGLD